MLNIKASRYFNIRNAQGFDTYISGYNLNLSRQAEQ